MIRHYQKRKLYNSSGRIFLDNQMVWNLPPRVVAKFGGEISRVMLDAAQAYIYQKCLTRQSKIFKEAAFQSKSHS